MNSTVSPRVLEAQEAIRKAWKAGLPVDGLYAVVNEEWNAILARYPRLFAGDNIGLGAGVGWWPALEESFAEITAILEKHPGLGFNAVQIKEKFGGLRFYYDTSVAKDCTLSEESKGFARQMIDQAVERAEAKASVACEVCGQPGKRRGGGWIRTLCDEHAKEQS